MSQGIAEPDTVVFAVWLDTLPSLVSDNADVLKGCRARPSLGSPLKFVEHYLVRCALPRRCPLVRTFMANQLIAMA